MIITLEQLVKINGGKNVDACEFYIDALNKNLPRYEIDTNLRISHFLAQIIHESGHLRYKKENLNYSVTGLRTVFGKYFNNDAIAHDYARNPEKIANRVYASRMGNGDEKSGDGYKYRGRGLIQLTGFNNYKECGEGLKLDLLKNPDLLCENSEVMVLSACWYWKKHGLNNPADNDALTEITKKINGGLNGFDDRKNNLSIAKKVLGVSGI